MKRRRGGRPAGNREVHAFGEASIAAGRDVINSPTYVGEIHLHGVAAAGLVDVQYVAMELARMVQAQWEEEARLRLLYNRRPIPVRWELRASLSDHPATIDRAAVRGTGTEALPPLEWEASSGDIDELARRFRDTQRRRLVIVGDAGSGKTTLAVQLLLKLLQTRTPDEPVPVLLPIASWDTARFPTLHGWVEDQLPRAYPALRSARFAHALHALAAGGRIMPVLDGLDELPAAARADVVTALNRSLGEGDQLILTSRTPEFAQAVDATRDVVNSAAALEARPLLPAMAADYLQSCVRHPDPGWQQVLDQLRTVGQPSRNETSGQIAALAAITATPLGVWLLRTVYTDPAADPTELTDSCPADHLRTRLLNAIVPAAIAAHPPANRARQYFRRRRSPDPDEPFRPRRRRNPADTERYLAYLAHLLTHDRNSDGTPRTLDMAWWQLAQPAEGSVRTLSRWVGILTSVIATAMLAVPTAMISRASSAILGGLVFGITTGIGAGAAVRSWSQSEPGHLRQTLRGDLPGLIRAIVKAAVESFWALLVVGCVLISLGVRPISVVVGLLGVALVTHGAVAGFVRWAEEPASTDRPSGPPEHLRADRKLNLLRIVAFGAGYGLVAVAGVTYFRSLGEGLLIGVVMALGAAIGQGLLGGAHRAWLAYAAMVARLSRERVLPRDLMPFLDDMHRLGLLRAVGPLYQFRHAELQDHFAATFRSRR
ncbi:NACHT domain-containing protein [Micromonospora sp. KC723]|uniref:NACHT domain-containing protein n=1 Tax=Micromonospora sp. KC723 TaxID=2530381 RepID=UPI00104EBB20|nr:NACHT domain-containing protein [Micromonospora sp. KC723]TDB76776.1 NACHT domain-containing protein [Micromonospora sp. KC723]